MGYKNISFVNNKPLYEVGDILIFENEVHFIESLIHESYTDIDKKRIDKAYKPSCRSCHKPGRKVKLNQNSYLYKLKDRSDPIREFSIIYAKTIGVNNFISQKIKQIDSLEESVHKAAEALGYNNEW